MNPGEAAAGEAVPARLTSQGIAFRCFGSGSPLVLMHGNVGSWRHWTRNIDALATIRSVLVPDLPGFGESADVDPGTTVDRYLDLVAASLDEMCPGKQAIDLVGFSFGGQIAAGSAVRLGDRARRLSLLTPSGFDLPVGRVLRIPRRGDFPKTEEGQRAFHREMLVVMMLADPSSVDEEAIDIQAANTARSRLDGRHISWSGRMPEMLADIQGPIQLIYGDRDPMPFPSASDRIRRCRAVRPDIRVDLVPGGGHWVQYECAEATNALLVDFLTAT